MTDKVYSKKTPNHNGAILTFGLRIKFQSSSMASELKSPLDMANI